MGKPFYPNAHASLAVTTTSAEVTTLTAADNILRIYNAGPSLAFVRWGTAAQTAVATDLAIPPGVVEMFTKNSATRLAAITSSGTATLYLSTGIGE